MAFIDTQRMLLDLQLQYRQTLADRDKALAQLELAVGIDLAALAPTGNVGLTLSR